VKCIRSVARFRVNYPHSLIPVRFVLASVAHLKGESDADSHTVALISAGVRLELNHGSRSVPVSAAEPGPGIQKLAVMVGRFTNEGEVKVGGTRPELTSDESERHR
jgi:hypothetical protein